MDNKDARALSAALASGEEEPFTADFVARLTAGKEQPLRVWREYRGQTLASLGTACGVSRLALSQIENSKKPRVHRAAQKIGVSAGLQRWTWAPESLLIIWLEGFA